MHNERGVHVVGPAPSTSGGPGSFNPLTTTGLFTQATEDSITAHAGGGKASATALSATKNLHRISVCATAADSVLMPAALAGQVHYLRNDGAAAAQVFGAGTDTINGVATGTGVSLPAGVGVWLQCTTAGNWNTGLGVNPTGSGAVVLATSPTITTPVVAGGAWATVSATTPADGTIARVTDVGRNGSYFTYNSTDVRWRPWNGSTSLFATAIPMILPSSGSIGNNGALSALTALPVQYASCYMFFPAAAIVAGSAAGLYYVVMSSTTAGTIYNNTYTSGLPTIPASPTPFVTTGPGAYTQTTASDITLLSFTVQGGLMGLNGALRTVSTWGVNNNANAKTAKEKYGANTALSGSLASTASGRHFGLYRNVGIATTQEIWSTGSMTGFGTSSVANSQITTDSTTDQTFTVTAQLATATDFMISSGFTVELSTQ